MQDVLMVVSRHLGFTLPDVCGDKERSSSFHRFVLEPQAKQSDAERCPDAAKALSSFKVNLGFLFVRRHERAGRKNK